MSQKNLKIKKPLIMTQPTIEVSFKNKYIIVPQKNNVLIFDQHAVHERILYDQYASEINNQTLITMPLLIPEYIQLTEPLYSKLIDALEMIQSIGFDIEPFDKQTFIIRETLTIFKNQYHRMDIPV